MRIAIVSASSDIGHALALHWRQRGWNVAGTFRTASEKTRELSAMGVELIHCDLDDPASLDAACGELGRRVAPWDALIVCPGTLEPIAMFETCDFGEWERSIRRNFVAQMRCIHALLPLRSSETPHGACVICWAGGGVNSAPRAFSAYTVSKIALIKMTELLDAEVSDARFAIIGPGWVKTKIHDQTLRAGERADAAYDATVTRLSAGASGDWIDMSRVIASCEWILASERAIVSGRNFSVAGDPWGTPRLAAALAADPAMYKLRRQGNEGRLFSSEEMISKTPEAMS